MSSFQRRCFRSRTTVPLLLAASIYAQSSPTFRTETRLVRVDAEVLEDGRVLTGFGPNDFRVLDEGAPQTIRHFSAGEDPLDLILLFDVSGSMNFVIPEVVAAAHAGLQELRPGDRVCIMTFNTKSQVIADFSEDLGAVQRTIEDDVLHSHFSGGTRIQTSVDDAALRFLRQPHSERRRAVLIITDNVGTRTRREQSVVTDFWEADAALSGLIVYNKWSRAVHTARLISAPELVLLETGMKGIAEKTGGDAINAQDAGTAFQESMRRIRTRYSLYYQQPSAKPGTTRNIRVELAGELSRRHPKARVRARTGYLVPRN